MMVQQAEAAAQFKYLFTPLRVGSFTARNRIVSTAHGTGLSPNGLPNQRHADYWGSKAKGGIGLVITEADPVFHTGTYLGGKIHLWRDDIVEPFRPVADAVHEHGARIVAQIWHGGRATYGQSPPDPVWAPSPIAARVHGQTPHEMTAEEIRMMVQAFAAAARRVREAGLDGVEIHAAHDYLPEQFMSPLSNQRQDDYGGSEENRLRFTHEVVAAVRAAVGTDFTVGIRVSGDQWENGGLHLEDMERIVPKLTASGQLDYVSVTFSMGGNVSYTLNGPQIPPMWVPPGQFVYLAAAIKQVTDLPVICVGRINNPVMAEQILSRNEADLIGMTRANICDPELPNKAREGRLDEIRYCIACNEGCVPCALNPSAGREAQSQINPAPVSKKVMVIGGGIAGMEATRVAAERGHQVTLYEKEQLLGGQLQIAAKAPDRGDMAEPVRFYTRQFERLKVSVHLGRMVDENLVRKESPDAVIVATGGLPASWPIEGLEDGKATGVNVVFARDVLAGTAVVEGEKVAVLATDQDMEGLTTADFLADRGKQVEVLIPFTEIGAKVQQLMNRPTIVARLAGKKVKLSTLTGVKALRDGTVIAFNPFSGEEWPLEGVQTLVLAAGSHANDILWKALRGQVKEIYGIGECVAPRRLLRSTLDGLQAGLQV